MADAARSGRRLARVSLAVVTAMLLAVQFGPISQAGAAAADDTGPPSGASPGDAPAAASGDPTGGDAPAAPAPDPTAPAASEGGAAPAASTAAPTSSPPAATAPAGGGPAPALGPVGSPATASSASGSATGVTAASGDAARAARTTGGGYPDPHDGYEPHDDDHDKPTGKIVVTKLVRDEHGDTSPAAGWTFSSEDEGVSPATAVTDDDGRAVFEIEFEDEDDRRHVTLTETLQDGWTLEQHDGLNAVCWAGEHELDVTNAGATGFTVKAKPDKTIYCKVVNKPPREEPPAKLTLKKTVINEHGGGAEPADWTLTATGPDQTLTGTSPVSATVVPGAYVLSESDGPPGYEAGDWECDGGEQAGDEITVAPGDDVTCRIENRDVPPHLTLVKHLIGGGAEPTDWTLTADGPVTITGTTGSAEVTGVEVEAGDYELSEDGPEGFDLVGWACDAGTLDGITLTLPLGTDATCTATNTVRGREVPPGWTLSKSSDPVSGSTVQPGDVVTYTLTATNTGTGPVTGIVVTDDLSDVLDDAAPGDGDGTTADVVASLGTAAISGDTLTWTVPDLAEGAVATVDYTVTVDADAFGVTLRNVATGTGTPPPDRCPPGSQDCTTEHETPTPVDLAILKLHRVTGTTGDRDVIVGEGDRFDYDIAITNVGANPATEVSMSDAIPDVLTVDPSTFAVTTTPDAGQAAGWVVALTGTNADGSGGTLTARFAGPFAPGDEAVISLTVTVGELPQPDPSVPPDPIVNTATVTSREPDDNPGDNTSTEETPVEAVTIEALGVCRDDVPYLAYSIDVIGLTPTLITLEWWNPTVFNGGNPTGPPTATQPIPVDQLSGVILWYGAAVDANGEPTDWPGWTLLPDGTWIEDPNAPGADLRPLTVVRIVVNPEVAAAQVYPPATPTCDASPPDNPGTPPGSPPGTPGGQLPRTGGDPATALAVGLGLVAVGAVLRRRAARRS